jgi:hypothetical protein
MTVKTVKPKLSTRASERKTRIAEQSTREAEQSTRKFASNFYPYYWGWNACYNAQSFC